MTKPEIGSKPANDASCLDRERLLHNGRVLLNNGDFVLARNVFAILVQQHPNDPECLLGLGTCLFHYGDQALALKCFRSMWEQAHDERALVWMGSCFLQGGKIDIAMSYFQRVLNPKQLPQKLRSQWHKDLGNAFAKLSRPDEAIKQYQKALEVEYNSDVMLNVGSMYVTLDELDKAEDTFGQVLEREPKNPKALCGLGLVHRQRGEIEEAERVFQLALENDPSNYLSLIQLMDTTRTEDAVKSLQQRVEKYFDSNPGDARMHYFYSKFCFLHSLWKESEVHVDAALELSPSNLQAQKLKEALLQNRHRYRCH